MMMMMTIFELIIGVVKIYIATALLLLLIGVFLSTPRLQAITIAVAKITARLLYRAVITLTKPPTPPQQTTPQTQHQKHQHKNYEYDYIEYEEIQ